MVLHSKNNFNLAIISPSRNAYSETFIQAHKQIDANIFYYYDGYLPRQLEESGGLLLNELERLIILIKKRFNSNFLSPNEVALAKSFKKQKIDFVFAEYGTTGVAVLNVCIKLKIPLGVMFHGYDASVFSVIEQYFERYQELFKYAKCIFSVSNKMHIRLLNMGCPSDKLFKATYGPNNIFLEIEPKFTFSAKFIAVGRFVNKKAPYYLILSFKQVLKVYPDAELYIAGEGELLEVSKNLVKYFKIERNIHFLGIIRPLEFAEQLSHATGFIQHSITAENGDMEGTPVSILEASAAGLPVIATCHGGIPDVIIDGVTGLLVSEHDVNGMAEKIIQIIENPDFAKQLGKQGKEYIMENFSMRKHIDLITATIRKSII